MKRQNGRSIAAVLLALTMAVGLAACGTEGGGDAADLTPAEVLQKSQEVLDAVKSVHYDMDLGFQMAADGQTIDVKTTSAVDYTSEPVSMKMEVKADVGGQTQDTTMYLVEEDGKAVMYMNTDGQWVNQEVADLSQYDATASMDLYFSSSENFEANGTETVNGVEANRYDGVIVKEDMAEVLDASGMDDMLAQMNMSSDDIDVTNLGDLPISIWIDPATYYPVKYEMDMTSFMQALMTQVYGDQLQGLEIKDVIVGMTMSQFDEVTPVELPAEATA